MPVAKKKGSNAAIAAFLKISMDEGGLVARRVCLNTGEVSLHASDGHLEFSVTDDTVIKVFGSGWHLLLVGDGQLARFLATMARMLDYRVIICDPREEFATRNGARAQRLVVGLSMETDILSGVFTNACRRGDRR